MKTKIQILLGLGLFFSAAFCTQVCAQSDVNIKSNIYSVSYLSGDNTEEAIYYKSRLQHGEIIPEILPANQDTNGNWGVSMEEWQLSARFRRHEFLTNEPVWAVIILRNLNSTSRTVALSDHSYKYILLQGTNKFIHEIKTPPRDQQREDSSESWYAINMKGEGLMVVHLKDYFDLSHPGEYSFQAQIRVPKLDGKGYSNVISGKASFQIVRRLSL